MKTTNILSLIFILSLMFFGCTSTRDNRQTMLSISLDASSDLPAMSIRFYKGKAFNHPSFALWLEELSGEYIRTLYVTKSYASGIFGHEMINDSVWKKTPGPSYQPAALPYWTHKKGLIGGKYLIPTPEHPFVDAYTGATPKQDFELKLSSKPLKNFRILLEVNQPWDWNDYWTNGKFPENKAYAHSAQPSIVYAVEINDLQHEFYLNPIGHGSPTGEDGNLYTDLFTLSTAQHIFSMIRVELHQ